jgi:hypothetical protein
LFHARQNFPPSDPHDDGNSDQSFYDENIEVLQRKVDLYENQLKKNKIFLYMVIHDLKHPTESMMSQLQIMDEKMTLTNQDLESTI